MSSRNMRLLPRATLHSDSEQERIWQKTPRSTKLEEMSLAVSFKLFWRIVLKATPLTKDIQLQLQSVFSIL